MAQKSTSVTLPGSTATLPLLFSDGRLNIEAGWPTAGFPLQVKEPPPPPLEDDEDEEDDPLVDGVDGSEGQPIRTAERANSEKSVDCDRCIR